MPGRTDVGIPGDLYWSGIASRVRAIDHGRRHRRHRHRPEQGRLPGATVTAKNNATNTTTTAVTDASGHFTVIRLNPGTYTVDVSLSGFTPFSQGGIIVEVGRVTNMDVTISVGGQVESVSVVAQAPVINRDRPTSPRTSIRRRSRTCRSARGAGRTTC